MKRSLIIALCCLSVLFAACNKEKPYEKFIGDYEGSGTINGTITVNIEETGCHLITIGQLYGGGNQAPYTGPLKAGSTTERQGPTLNLRSPDPECAPLDYIAGEGRAIDAEYVMSNNFAFGGVNTSLVFRRTDG